MKRLLAVKSFLWLLVGAAGMVALFRFRRGLGATTALTDLTPWGFWIGFDVMGGVALAAGGFVIAATVYVFHLERYHSIVRPAVLTAFLGYVAVVVGLLFDLGLPWNIWHMIVFWNPHSPLFEVGWCVMLYTAVLGLEFAPLVLEMAKHPLLQKLYGILKKATIPLVILGIMLSTLHQSSLGSLFLIMPHRLHPLWYTPILPVLFYISALGLGLMMVTTEGLVSSWLYEQEPELPQLRGLGKAGAWVLWIYTAVKLGDLAVRGRIGTLFEGSFESNLFILEMLISAIVPATLLSIPSIRNRFAGLATAAGMAVTGFVMNRIDVGGLATIGTTGTRYIPSWMEVLVSVGVVAGAGLVYFFVAEHFHLFHAGAISKERFRHALPQFDPATQVVRLDPYTWGPARFTLMLVAGAAIALALLPRTAFSGIPVEPEPVTAPGFAEKIVLDGNRVADAVLFDHRKHVEREGNRDSCPRCHHLLRPGEEATGCARCHRDMNIPVSIFDHDLHGKRLAAGPGCVACHRNPGEPKDTAHAKPCLECHTRMTPERAVIRPRKAPGLGLAVGYKEAFHGLCVKCHEERAKVAELAKPRLGECASCHAGKVLPPDPVKPDEPRFHAAAEAPSGDRPAAPAAGEAG